jgi:hypothetical protein
VTIFKYVCFSLLTASGPVLTRHCCSYRSLAVYRNHTLHAGRPSLRSPSLSPSAAVRALPYAQHRTHYSRLLVLPLPAFSSSPPNALHDLLPFNPKITQAGGPPHSPQSYSIDHPADPIVCIIPAFQCRCLHGPLLPLAYLLLAPLHPHPATGHTGDMLAG